MLIQHGEVSAVLSLSLGFQVEGQTDHSRVSVGATFGDNEWTADPDQNKSDLKT